MTDKHEPTKCPVCDSENILQHDPPSGWECHDCGTEWTTFRYPDAPETSAWDDNSIQFPRLLAEIYATVTLTDEQWRALESSMDLMRDDILDVMFRADQVWQRMKLPKKGTDR